MTEQQNDYMRRWTAQHPGWNSRPYKKQWTDANRELVRVSQRACSRLPLSRFKKARREAKHPWLLSEQEYYSLIGIGRCFYCFGELPSVGSGLDRLDSNKGYEIGNVVPCCRRCNARKTDTSFSQMAGMVALWATVSSELVAND